LRTKENGKFLPGCSIIRCGGEDDHKGTTMSRINNSLTSQQLGAAENLQSATGAARRAELVPTSQPQTITHTPAPEVQQALNALAGVPQVRPEVVQQVAQRLGTGQFQTRSAAEQTAAALLSTPPAAEPAGDTTTPAASTPPGPASPPAQSPAAELDSGSQTPDLFQLLDSLNHIPVLRQEVVAEVAQRLAAGQLSIPAATEPTVQAILETTGRNE
jgi:hypothetical protein